MTLATSWFALPLGATRISSVPCSIAERTLTANQMVVLLLSTAAYGTSRCMGHSIGDLLCSSPASVFTLLSRILTYLWSGGLFGSRTIDGKWIICGMVSTAASQT